MNPVPVVWWSMTTDARGCFWDQSFLEDLFAGRVWDVPGGVTFEHHVITDPAWALPDTDGAVFVVPARHNLDHVDTLNEVLARYRWVVVIGTGDEEAMFLWEKVSHPRRKIWAQGTTPDVGGVDRPFGSGYSPGFPELVATHRLRAPGRLDVFFCGQDTHQRRHDCVEACRAAAPADRRLVIPTSEFLATDTGLSRELYAAGMTETKVAPCPSGPKSLDTFRVFEALEAGAVPVVDGSTPDGRVDGYWPYLFGEPVPFPVLDNWGELAEHVENVRSSWPVPASRTSAWWLQHKRAFAYQLDADLRELSGTEPGPTGPDDLITIVIPTCPINAHPDTTMIETVVESVRAQLPHAEIIVACDGIRPGMEHKTADYEEHLLRLTRLCAGWSNVVPIILPGWGHQANGFRAGLELVTTPLLLFVEHDTPIVGEIDWAGLCYIIQSGAVNVVRLHHETRIGEYHQHMMVDDVEHPYGATDEHPGVPLVRTLQWSQRPHLATTRLYRERVMPYFGHDSRTYIEWIMHGAIQHGLERGTERTWANWRVAIYHPAGGNIQRSTHLDGRAGASIEEAVWAYDGPPPDGAPAPTERTV